MVDSSDLYAINPSDDAVSSVELQQISASRAISPTWSNLFPRLFDKWSNWMLKKTPSRYLTGNFEPVASELEAVACSLQAGTLPTCLIGGAYCRTGPNPLHTPAGGYHWFDGDGMLHLVKITSDKDAVYTNRWVRTSRWQQEKANSRPLFIKLGDMKGWAGLFLLLLEGVRSKMLDLTKGISTANTALAFSAGRLLSLNEGDLPYAVRILCNGMIEDLGRLTYHGFKGKTFTAHPKLHPKTKELAFFGYDFERHPYMRAGLINDKGNMTKAWEVDLKWPTMAHDMGATDNFLILLHLPLILDPSEMTKGPNIPLRFDKNLPARIGLLRRDSSPGVANVQWFDLPAFYLFHVAGAYEENGKVHMFGCSMREFDFKNIETDAPLPPSMLPQLHEYVMDPSTGRIEEPRLVSSVCGDFPVINTSRTCLSFKYAYLASFGSRNAMMDGICKINVQDRSGADGSVGSIKFGEGCWGGEAVFVPRSTDGTEDEDDGFLVVFVFSDKSGESTLNVYNAKTMSNEPVAVIKLPQRVPFGFHGAWLTAEELAEQHIVKM
jgi:carotenoid cleavage dioxygenase-like enzyme